MVTRCVNPQCSRPFRYFREGRLFAIEVEEEAAGSHTPTGSGFGSKKHRTEFFWLCADCSRHLTLRFRRIDGTMKSALEPLLSRSAQQSNQDEEEKSYEAA